MQPSIRASARCHHLPTTRPTLRTLFLRAGSCHRADKAGNLQQPKLSAASVKGARTMNMSTNATSQSNVATAESTLAAEDLVQYVVLRRDLWTEKSWPLGSVIAQGCHASTAALWLSRESQATKAYCAPDKLDSMHKVRPCANSHWRCVVLMHKGCFSVWYNTVDSKTGLD